VTWPAHCQLSAKAATSLKVVVGAYSDELKLLTLLASSLQIQLDDRSSVGWLQLGRALVSCERIFAAVINNCATARIRLASSSVALRSVG
jgi:hypothetical protein